MALTFTTPAWPDLSKARKLDDLNNDSHPEWEDANSMVKVQLRFKVGKRKWRVINEKQRVEALTKNIDVLSVSQYHE